MLIKMFKEADKMLQAPVLIVLFNYNFDRTALCLFDNCLIYLQLVISA